nr:STAS domain-containing protein [Roseovarius sp. W115]
MDLRLQARFDGASVGVFMEDLRSRKGGDVCIDGSNVSFCGALGVQALVSAQKQWQADGYRLALKASSELLACCATLGVDITALGLLADDGEAA